MDRWLGQKHAVLLLREQQCKLVTAKQRVAGYPAVLTQVIREWELINKVLYIF
jgi:hypothetical protein